MPARSVLSILLGLTCLAVTLWPTSVSASVGRPWAKLALSPLGPSATAPVATPSWMVSFDSPAQAIEAMAVYRGRLYATGSCGFVPSIVYAFARYGNSIYSGSYGGSLYRAQLASHALYLPFVSKPFPHIVNDDFSNPASGWPSWDTASSAAGYVGDEYRILGKEQDTVAHAGLGGAVSDFVVQVDARATASLDGSDGIYFAYHAGSYYLFEVSNGSYALHSRDGWSGALWSIIDWTASPWLRNGHQTNTLKVSKNHSQISLYANGHLLVQRTDVPVGAGGVGLAARAASTNYEARFDNFSLLH